MDEVMTWAEIEEAFDGEWVLIEDPEMTSSPEILGGKVIFHSRSRAEIHEKVMELSRLNHAILFVGQPDQNMVFAL